MQGGNANFRPIRLGVVPPVLILTQDTMQIVSNASQRGRRDANGAQKEQFQEVSGAFHQRCTLQDEFFGPQVELNDLYS